MSSVGARIFVIGAIICILIGALASQCEFPEWEHCTLEKWTETCTPKTKE